MSKFDSGRYNSTHKALRRILRAQYLGRPCARCGKVLEEADHPELDHADDGRGYVGFSCRRCNRAAGAAKARGETGAPQPRSRTDWTVQR